MTSQTMLIHYPTWLRIGIFWSAVVHDLAILGMAYAAWQESPITIILALGNQKELWAGMLAVGGVLSLTGVIIRNNRFESTGVVLTSAAKLVWIAALLQASFSPLGAETLAFALLAGAAGTMWRFFGLWVGNYLRSGG